ncbi:MAG: AAA family ATPase, partial [Victivallales bacterium]|nr:AAA family ATPase [Victivallales bacterium]
MIQQLDVENFTVFKKAAFEFGSQLNIFIGENGTGKTQILKLIYAVVTMFSKSQELNQPVKLKDGSKEAE